MGGLRLRSLKVYLGGAASQHEAMIFLQTQPELSELAFDGDGVSVKYLVDVGRCLPRLQRIRVNINEPGTYVVPLFLVQMENLHEIELSVDDEIAAERRQVILLGSLRCPELRMITLENLRVVPADLQKFFQNSPNVHTIALDSFSCSSWPELFDSLGHVAHVRIYSVVAEDQNAYFSNRLENLQTLELCGCRWSEQHLVDLIRQCPNVVELTLRDLRCVTGAVVESVCAHMKRLQKFTFEEPSLYNATTKSSFKKIIRQGYPSKVLFVQICRVMNAHKCSGFRAHMN